MIGAPVDVFHTHCGLVPVYRTGRLEDRYHAQMSEAMNNMWAPVSFDRRALPASVVDARKRFDDRLLKHRHAQYDAKYKWKPYEVALKQHCPERSKWFSSF